MCTHRKESERRETNTEANNCVCHSRSMEYNSKIMLDTDAAANTNANWSRSNNGATQSTDRYACRLNSQSIKQTITSSIAASSLSSPPPPLSVPSPLTFFPWPPSRCKYKRPAWTQHCLWMYLMIWFCYPATCKLNSVGFVER